MTNKELSVILRLRDEASKRLEGFKGNLQRFANTWKQNWLAITATVTAAIMALSKAWDLMQEGAKAQQIEASFRNMAEGMGLSAEKMKQAILDVSAGTVNFSNVADKITALMAQGLGMDQITALMKQARAEARIFGQTTEEAFENIANAVNSGMMRPLEKTYGLQVSLKDAINAYAKATGMSTQEVERNYQAQAVANHILAQSRMHLEAVNLEVMTNYEKVQMIKSKWNDFAETAGQALWHVLGFLQGFTYQVITGFFVLLEIGTTVFQKLLIPLIKFYELLGKLPGAFGEAYRNAAESIKKFSAVLEEQKRSFSSAADENARKALDQYELVFAKTKDTGDKTAGILKEVARQVKQQAQETAQGFNAMLEFAKQTAHGMENAFSDIFFKAFTGQLGSVQEVFANFGRTILQTISQILAKILMIKLLTASAGPGGQFLGVSVNQLFHHGGMVRRHRGGMIYAHNGLAPDEVPIIAQTGEGVLSRRGMNALGGSDNLRQLNNGNPVQQPAMTVNVTQVIQAWDAQDVWRNRKALSSAVADDIYNNGKIRSVIRSYA